MTPSAFTNAMSIWGNMGVWAKSYQFGETWVFGQNGPGKVNQSRATH